MPINFPEARLQRSIAPGVAARCLALLLVLAGSLAAAQTQPGERIKVVPLEAENRVDISIDGKPFTSYIWPETLAKPVLYPLRTAKGTLLTRGWPLQPRPGERVDHPHHVGLWFNYGNVNGIDFWNNSEAISKENASKMGVIRQRKILAAKSGAEEGQLEVQTVWLTSDKKILLEEHTLFLFRGDPNFRSIDRITTLRALEQKVVFADDKEGLLGLRVARELETPSGQPEVFTDASGRATLVRKLDDTGVNGVYRSSEGKTGDAVWGTRGRWSNLSGFLGSEPVTITILDHPGNPGFPTYWHARGYGLFAANPLGRKIFTEGKESLNFTLAPGESVTFRYRIRIWSEIATPEATEAAYREFMESYP